MLILNTFNNDFLKLRKNDLFLTFLCRIKLLNLKVDKI